MLQLAAVASYSPCEPRPRVSGAFHLMARRDKVIKIKAKVYKPESFALVDPPEVMRLEPCLVGEPLAARPRGEARVLLRNTTPRRRVFVIEGRCAESRKCGCGISPGGGGHCFGFLSLFCEIGSTLVISSWGLKAKRGVSTQSSTHSKERVSPTITSPALLKWLSRRHLQVLTPSPTGHKSSFPTKGIHSRSNCSRLVTGANTCSPLLVSRSY